MLKTDSSPKNRSALDYPATAFLAKTLGDENRLRIIMTLRGGKKPVSRIVEELGISQPLVSHHLKELKRAMLVAVERDGPFVFYELADRRILTILADLDCLATDLLTRRTVF
ncbi:MAG: metalloregulator ArsR/SmtB family transcription factor [Deltaproteobacteria bacterium]